MLESNYNNKELLNVLFAVNALTISLNRKYILTIGKLRLILLMVSFSFLFLSCSKEESQIKKGAKIEKESNDKKIRFNDLDPDKIYYKDLIFNWGVPKLITSDSSFIIYGSLGIDDACWDGETYVYFNKDSTIFKIHGETYLLFNIRNFKKYINISYQDCGDLGDKIGFFMAYLNLKKVIFLGIYGNTPQDKGIYIGWNSKKIINFFDEPEKIWISDDYLIRVYKIEDMYFFLKNNYVYAYGISSNENLHPNVLIPFTDGKKLTLEKD